LSSADTPLHWRQILRNNFFNWKALADFLELNDTQRQVIFLKPPFPINIPLRLAKKIQKSTLEDPILKQFLPTIEEEVQLPSFLGDPVGDKVFRRSSKLLQKYQGRALLLCTSACAMHCRYCFRQNFDYDTHDKLFEDEIKILSEDPTIREVILSGGDPLSLSDDSLKGLFTSLCALPHIRRIRIHSRFPIGIPERIDTDFLRILSEIPVQVWFVIHVNHPNELDADILNRLSEMRKLGIVLLNQAVLLRGINDDVETLKSLCEVLVDNGILPYYLHQLDRVQGSAHFEVPVETGKRLIQEISKQLPGYAVPKYVKEVFGELSKTAL
jgi:EF-P beta-lysylation protein EpmB